MSPLKTSVAIEAVDLRSFVCPEKSLETSALKALDRDKKLKAELAFKCLLLLSVEADPAVSSGECFLKFE